MTAAAAAWSWVEKMLHDTQRTSAPNVVSVSISTAVWMVMCSDPMMRALASGWLSANSARRAMSPGISTSASSISLRPQLASDRSATLKSPSERVDMGYLPDDVVYVPARPPAVRHRAGCSSTTHLSPRSYRG